MICRATSKSGKPCQCRATCDPDDAGTMTRCGRHSRAHAERAAERMRKRHADPEFAKAHAERMRKINADPEFNPLVLLTNDERAEYDLLKRSGYSREDALASIGRADILDQKEDGQ